MVPISQKYHDTAIKMVESSSQLHEISKHNVYQEGNDRNRALVDTIVEELLVPGSHLDGFENLKELHRLAQSGKSCLILMEHYSNFDIPCLYYLLNQQEEGHQISSSIVSMAGMKLNTDSKFVLAFTEAYTRIVIYPSRSLASITDPATLAQERKRSSVVNRAAMHEMVRQKHAGKLILMFPSGTRYRPGKEDTKRGVKEVDSYLKSFHYMVLIGIAGNVLRVSPTEDMSEDLVTRDAIVYSVSPVTSCHDYRKHAKTKSGFGAEQSSKQHVADTVMSDLETYHQKAEAARAPLLVHRNIQ
ncbi:MAG TPA: 1-acyl-sn-glycerol-3-phosphate acyltransferase [Spirochaetia bacterium]|nr:1-acyl-sn-glycerol-3-phosphate acyltransferase [Spirochaetia bacterium]